MSGLSCVVVLFVIWVALQQRPGMAGGDSSVESLLTISIRNRVPRKITLPGGGVSTQINIKPEHGSWSRNAATDATNQSLRSLRPSPCRWKAYFWSPSGFTSRSLRSSR